MTKLLCNASHALIDLDLLLSAVDARTFWDAHTFLEDNLYRAIDAIERRPLMLTRDDLRNRLDDAISITIYKIKSHVNLYDLTLSYDDTGMSFVFKLEGKTAIMTEETCCSDDFSINDRAWPIMPNDLVDYFVFSTV